MFGFFDRWRQRREERRRERSAGLATDDGGSTYWPVSQPYPGIYGDPPASPSCHSSHYTDTGSPSDAGSSGSDGGGGGCD